IVMPSRSCSARVRYSWARSTSRFRSAGSVTFSAFSRSSWATWSSWLTSSVTDALPASIQSIEAEVRSRGARPSLAQDGALQDGALIAYADAPQYAVALVVNDPLAPPHATAGVFFLVPWVSGANVCRDRQSEPDAALSECRACGQNRQATCDDAPEVCDHLQRKRSRRNCRLLLVPASAAVPATAAEKQHQDNDDQKSRGIHIALLS